MTQNDCYHCGLPVDNNTDYSVVIDNQERPMCCLGCRAVAQAIIDNGLDSFYKYRTEQSRIAENLVPDILSKLSLYDRPEIQKSFVRSTQNDNTKQASLILEGIVCAACVWLNEQHVSQIDGVLEFRVNYATHRAQLVWDDSKLNLSTILKAISDIGYQAHPLDPKRYEQIQQKERRLALRRLLVAGLGAMQVMMIAVALYAGADMETSKLGSFLRWASLLIAVPVVLYSAQTFFINAWRDLRTRRLSMDVPVAIAIGSATLASIIATFNSTGDVYFDSVTMFTFFLLGGRFLEMNARHRAGQAADELVKLIPAMALRENNDSDSSNGIEETVSVADIRQNDIVIVKPGEVIPIDGLIIEGNSGVNESLLTGESLAIQKKDGDNVIGGSVNIDSVLRVKVTHVGQDTVLASIQRLLERAQTEKPKLARLADTIASYFVFSVLFLTLIVALYWWQTAPDDAFWIVISILVVTCPCALSLATPISLTAATGHLTKLGVLTTRGHALETLASVTDIIFDKTGTLTYGEMRVDKFECYSDLSKTQCLQIAASLEQYSEHPIATAINKAFATESLLSTDDLSMTPGQGIEASINGNCYRIGHIQYALSDHTSIDNYEISDMGSTLVALANEDTLLALFYLSDGLRDDAGETINALQNSGYDIHLLSGDRKSLVESTAAELNILQANGEMTPAQKLHYVQNLQKQGRVVAMVGDGVNDAPVLAAAQVSIAMGEGTQLAQASADMILLSKHLNHLSDALYIGRRTRTIIWQNLSWAILYNLIAIPLAAVGWVAPWMAAIGMSSSSLIVVLNSLRLSRTRLKSIVVTDHVREEQDK